MRFALTALLGLMALAVQAFDSAEWLEKRGLLRCEAERLRALYDYCVAHLAEPAENVVVPVETFADGSVKTRIIAKKAQYFHSKGLVWAEDVVLIKNDEEGVEKAKIVARHCVIDRQTKSGWAEGAVELHYGATTFTGEGVYFSSPEGYVSVRQKSDVVSTDLKFGGVGE